MKPSALNLSDQNAYNQNALRDELCREFDRLNEAYFQGRLTVPEIVVSSRKTYGGYYQPKLHRIVVSWQAHREHGMAETLNTFRHEVAHIVHPHHRREFWVLAHSLGVTRRYASSPLVTRQPKYTYACPACGKQIVRRRRLRLSSCASCDPRFNPRYALRLVTHEVSAAASTGT